VSNSLLTRKFAVIALAAAAVLGGGVAYAYPPGQALTVSATASPDGAGKTTVLVTVSNANPSCQIRLEVDGTQTLLPKSASTTITTSLTINSVAGRHSISARTEGCTKGSKEHAKSRFVILDAKTESAPTTRVRKNYLVRLHGFAPASTVTLIATGPGGVPQLTESDTVDRRGDAKVKFKFPVLGTWSIVTTVSPAGGTAVSPITVQVTN
jgi:type 1 fimbria pilin